MAEEENTTEIRFYDPESTPRRVLYIGDSWSLKRNWMKQYTVVHYGILFDWDDTSNPPLPAIRLNGSLCYISFSDLLKVSARKKEGFVLNHFVRADSFDWEELRFVFDYYKISEFDEEKNELSFDLVYVATDASTEPMRTVIYLPQKTQEGKRPFAFRFRPWSRDILKTYRMKKEEKERNTAQVYLIGTDVTLPPPVKRQNLGNE